MSQDQAAQGYEDDEYRSTGWLLIIGVAIVAALFSLVSHHSSSGAAPTPPAPSAFAPPSPSASAPASASASASQEPSSPPSRSDPTAAILRQISGYVSVGEVCSPITDGKTTLTVRFLLRNVSGLSEHLVSVIPELPMGGLISHPATVQGGDCAHPAGKAKAPSTATMPQGGTLVVSLRFGLPHSCPAPYPVQAVVEVDIAGQQRFDTVAIYTDLGTVKFDLCKGRPTP